MTTPFLISTSTFHSGLLDVKRTEDNLSEINKYELRYVISLSYE